MAQRYHNDRRAIAFDPILYPEIYPDHLVWIVVVVLRTTVVAGIAPALHAGRVAPAEAIRLV